MGSHSLFFHITTRTHYSMSMKGFTGSHNSKGPSECQVMQQSALVHYSSCLCNLCRDKPKTFYHLGISRIRQREMRKKERPFSTKLLHSVRKALTEKDMVAKVRMCNIEAGCSGVECCVMAHGMEFSSMCVWGVHTSRIREWGKASRRYYLHLPVPTSIFLSLISLGDSVMWILHNIQKKTLRTETSYRFKPTLVFESNA